MPNEAAQSLVNEFTSLTIRAFAIDEGLVADNVDALTAAERILTRFADLQTARLATRSFRDHQALLQIERKLESWTRLRRNVRNLWPWVAGAGVIVASILSFFCFNKYSDISAAMTRTFDDVTRVKSQADEGLKKVADTREKVMEHAFKVSSDIDNLFSRTNGIGEDIRKRFDRNAADFERLRTSFTNEIDEIVADHIRLEIEMLMTELDDAIVFSFNPDTEANLRQAKSLQSVNLLIQHVSSHHPREAQQGPTKEQKILLALHELADVIGQVSRIREIIYRHESTETSSGNEPTRRLKAIETEINALEQRTKRLHFDRDLFNGLRSSSDDPKKEPNFPNRAEAFRLLTLGNIPIWRFEGIERRTAPERLLAGEPYLREIIDGDNSVRWQARTSLAVLYLSRAETADGNTIAFLNNAVRQLEEAELLADSATTRAETANGLANAYYRIAHFDFEQGKAAGANGAVKIATARKALEDAERSIRRALRVGAFTAMFPIVCATDAEILATSVIFDQEQMRKMPDIDKNQLFLRIREKVERSQGKYESYGYDRKNFFANNPVYEQIARILGKPDPNRIERMKQDILGAAFQE
jgi:hypothetical protein